MICLKLYGDILSLKEGVSFDYEKVTSSDVSVTVTDSAGNTFNKDFTIDVNDRLDYYSFPSKFIDGEDSVAYGGQVARHVLINELNNFVNSYFGDVNTFNAENTFDAMDLEADVMAQLNSYYSPDDALYAEISVRPLTTATVVTSKQATLADISGSTKNLVGKIAGKDPKANTKIGTPVCRLGRDWFYHTR